VSTIPQLLLPDERMAQLVTAKWIEPSKYQARTMLTTFLCETGGDSYALYLNLTGDFAGTLDRGWCAINERAIIAVRKALQKPPPDSADFIDPVMSVEMAFDIWIWRFNTAIKNKSFAEALVFAYNGWSTYRDRRTKYAEVWPSLWKRAGKALDL
jgi:hypothetical protein